MLREECGLSASFRGGKNESPHSLGELGDLAVRVRVANLGAERIDLRAQCIERSLAVRAKRARVLLDRGERSAHVSDQQIDLGGQGIQGIGFLSHVLLQS